jgi:hypothetical protein
MARRAASASPPLLPPLNMPSNGLLNLACTSSRCCLLLPTLLLRSAAAVATRRGCNAHAALLRPQPAALMPRPGRCSSVCIPTWLPVRQWPLARCKRQTQQQTAAVRRRSEWQAVIRRPQRCCRAPHWVIGHPLQPADHGTAAWLGPALAAAACAMGIWCNSLCSPLRLVLMPRPPAAVVDGSLH